MNKVILLAPTPPPAGGIAGWTVRMMNATLKNGWQVAVVDEKVIGGRQVFGDKTKRNLLTEAKRCMGIWRNLKKELTDPNAKVVHSCIPSVPLAMMREYVCACITKHAKRKFIIHFRCTVPNAAKGRLAHFMLKRLCNKADLIMTLNEQTNAYLDRFTKTPKCLIPNFVTEQELCSRETIRETVQTVLYVGGVIQTKGAMDMLEVARQFPNIQFRMVGKSESQVEEYARRHQITNVVFTGPKERREVRQEMMDADVFMFLTYFHGEGFSNALAEAMATGLPCIATDWAANRDMIEDQGGCVVPVKAPQEAAKALERMLPREVRAKQAAWNLRKVQAEYLDTVVLDQYVDVYESLTKKG